MKHLKHLTLQIFASLALLLCPFVSVNAQGTATVFGRVTDSSDAIIPGAKVTATNVNTNARRETVSDEQGNFLLSNLPVGVYRVEIEQSGFKRYAEQNVQLQVDERRQVNAA